MGDKDGSRITKTTQNTNTNERDVTLQEIMECSSQLLSQISFLGEVII